MRSIVQVVPKFSFGVPWFMYDLSNKQLIVSKIVPSDIRDTKDIILAETPIPGLNYHPVMPGGGGNRKLAFTLQLVKRDNFVGNVLLLKQFDMLRNQAKGFGALAARQFNPMPKVLYYWGTGSLPLVYWVAKADPTHKQGWVNSFGQPMYSEIEIELLLDETHAVYKAEEAFRRAVAVISEKVQIAQVALGSMTPIRTY